MSHWVEGKKALEYPEIKDYVRWCLQEAFVYGYGFNYSHHSEGRPHVELFIRKSTSRQSMMFGTAMRILAIDCRRGCGLTWIIEAEFHAAIRDFKNLIRDTSDVAPEYDKNTD